MSSNKPTIIFIPEGMPQRPLSIKRVDKPMLFHTLPLASTFTTIKNGVESQPFNGIGNID